MALGDPVIVKDRISPSRFNAKTYHWSDATTLHNMATTPCMIVIPTSTGFEFTINQPRFRNATNDGWINLGQSKHSHNANDDMSGGDFAEVLLDNIGRAYEMDRMGINAAQFAQKLAGTGSSITDDYSSTRSRVKFLAGTTLNASAIGEIFGAEIDWGNPSRMIAIVQCLEDTSMLARVGCNPENVSIANHATKKYGWEVCDNATEGKFYLVFSADGVSRTTSGGTTPIIAGTPTGVHLLHQPSINVKMSIDGVETIPPMVVKGSNIPSSGGSAGTTGDDMAPWKAGVLAKAASASRTLLLSALKYAGRPNSLRWFQSPPEG